MASSAGGAFAASTGSARLARVLGVLGCLVLPSASCLVTDKPEFGEPNVPASLRIVRPATFTRVTPIEDPLCATSSSSTGPVNIDRQQMGFEVEVFDANIADKLETRLLVNGDYAGEEDVPTTGEVARGLKRVCLAKRELKNACNHVELVVSRGFKGPGRYRATDPEDLAIAEWWVLPAAAQNPMANGDACAGLIDAGVP